MSRIPFQRTAMTLLATVLAVAGAAVVAAPAAAAPPTPTFGPDIEGWAPDAPQRTCQPDPKPGAVAFMNLLNDTYGRYATEANISRACGGSVSEHKEGRALDYMLDLNDSTERAHTNDILGWLLATDRHGNEAANARRLGIMYIISNRRIWSQARHSEGWRSYSCDGSASDCHTNHIHFSFTWPGARKQTSWWTGQISRPTGTVVDVSGDGHGDLLTVKADGGLWYYPNNIARDGVPFGTGTQVGRGFTDTRRLSAADISGDGYADLVAATADGKLMYYPNNIARDGKPYGSGTPVGQGFGDTTRVLAADVSGDGYADLLTTRSNGDLWYYPNNIVRDGVPYATGTPVGHGFAADALITAGDVTGDGYADLVTAVGGALTYYPNNIERDGRPYGTGVPAGQGWSGVNHIRLTDISGDGYADLVALRNDATLAYYPNNIARDGAPYANSTPVGRGFTGINHLP